jgi:hypothetical protein
MISGESTYYTHVYPVLVGIWFPHIRNPYLSFQRGGGVRVRNSECRCKKRGLCTHYSGWVPLELKTKKYLSYGGKMDLAHRVASYLSPSTAFIPSASPSIPSASICEHPQKSNPIIFETFNLRGASQYFLFHVST